MGDLLAKYNNVVRKKTSGIEKDYNKTSKESTILDNENKDIKIESNKTLSPFCACLQKIWIASKLKLKSTQVISTTKESNTLEVINAAVQISSSSSSITTTQNCNKLAILFLIIDDFPHEAIWRTWLHKTQSMNNTNDDDSSLSSLSPRVKIYFHAKYPDKVTSPWVRQHLLKESFKP